MIPTDLARMVAATLAALGTAAAHAAAAHAAAAPPLRAPDLADLTLEQLGSIEVTSVARRAQRLADAPASIFVITGDDIRRSGATTLPEALRLAPNLNVARADANQYAISARGFNNTLANKMLVLMDGRTVYSPLFSGVFWEAQDVMLEDVERIEVISGPGATLWGANAVNGVINIITRGADETQGALATAGAGSRENAAGFRHGGKIDGGAWRAYAKYGDQRPTRLPGGTSLRDASDRSQAGFRADWTRPTATYTLQGDAYTSDLEQGSTTRRSDGANVLARMRRLLEDGGTLHLQGYVDRTGRDQPGAIRETLTTYDLEAHHGLRVGRAHQVLWGGGYRHGDDRLENLDTRALAFIPPGRKLRWANLFVQDEIELAPRLALTVGLKLESNPYTGTEKLPTARLAWKPTAASLLWASLSRAVRAPSRVDRELFIPGTPPFLLAGGPNFRSEVTTASEIGYRAQAGQTLTYSINVFHNRHEDLRSAEPAPAGLVFANKIEGASAGISGWGTWRATPSWRLSAGGVVLRQRLHRTPDSQDAGGLQALGNDPPHWWTLRSSLDIGPGRELDLMVRRVGALTTPALPAYTAVDLRFGWRLLPRVEASVSLQNLLDPAHPEWGVPGVRPEFRRSVFLKIVYAMQ